MYQPEPAPAGPTPKKPPGRPPRTPRTAVPVPGFPEPGREDEFDSPFAGPSFTLGIDDPEVIEDEWLEDPEKTTEEVRRRAVAEGEPEHFLESPALRFREDPRPELPSRCLQPILCDTIDALERSGAAEDLDGGWQDPDDPHAEFRHAPLMTFEVVRTRWSTGMQVRESTEWRTAPKVWVRNRAAARYFRPGDTFLLTWDGETYQFVPPAREDWKG